MKNYNGTISIIGNGNVAGSLATALKEVTIWGRDPRKNRELALQTGALPAAELEEALTADLVLLVVPDSALSTITRSISELETRYTGGVIAHLSAVEGPEILQPLSELGFSTGKCHPMYPFPTPSTPLPANVIFGIEGDERALSVLKDFVHHILGIPVMISPEERVLYHLAGIFASNFVMAMVGIAETFVSRSCPGVNPPDILLPLLEGTLHNYQEFGAKKGITGPWIRGDRTTIESHLGALEGTPVLENIYRALGKRITPEGSQLADIFIE